jgi:hypothetical protein
VDLSNVLTVPWWVGVAGPPLLYGVLLLALIRRRTPQRILLGVALLVGAHTGLGAAAGAAFAAVRQEPFERALVDALRTFVQVPLLQLTWLPLMILPIRWVLRPPRWARKRRAAARPARRRSAPAAAPAAGPAPPPVPLLTFVDSSAPRPAPPAAVAAASARGIIGGRADVLMIEEVMPGTFSPGGTPAVPLAPAAEPPAAREAAAPAGGRGAIASREPGVRIPFERIRSQLPASAFVWSLDAIAAELRDPHHLVVPRSVIVPQLGEGAVKVGWEVVADQFPRACLATGEARIAAALPGGVLLLPLDEVIRQVPAEVFDLPAAAVVAARDIEAFPEPFRRAPAGEDEAEATTATTTTTADAGAFLDVETLEPLPEPPPATEPSLADRVAAAGAASSGLLTHEVSSGDIAFDVPGDREAEPAPPVVAEAAALDGGVTTPDDATSAAPTPVPAAPAAPATATETLPPGGAPTTVRVATPPVAEIPVPVSAAADGGPGDAEPLDIVEAGRPHCGAARDVAAAAPAPVRFPAVAHSSTHTTVESLLAALEEAEAEEPAAPPARARGVEATAAEAALLVEARRAAAALAPLAPLELAATAAPGAGVITLTAGAWTPEELAATAGRLAPLFGRRGELGVLDQITLRGSEGGAVVTALEAGAVPTVLAVAVDQSGALALLEILSRRAAGEGETRSTGGTRGGAGGRGEVGRVERVAVGPAVLQRLRAAAAPLAPLGPLVPSVFGDAAGEARLYVFVPPASDAAAVAALAHALAGATSEKVAVTSFSARLTAGGLSVRRLSAPAAESAVLVVWEDGRAPRGRVHRVVARAARGLEE